MFIPNLTISKRRWGGIFIALGIGLACAAWLLAMPLRAGASGMVGNGTPGSCTEAAVRTTILNGGLITFNCGANPVTITLTSMLEIRPPTSTVSLDGGGLITLDGAGATRLFYVDGGAPPVTLTLKNMKLINGLPSDPNPGGAVLNNSMVIIENTTFYSNTNAIFNSGILTISGSTFDRNTDSYGGAAITNNNNQITIVASTFISNTAPCSGAISNGSGTLTVSGSTFIGNSSPGLSCSPGDNGGAIGNLGGTVVVQDSTFDQNQSLLSGGGIASVGALTIAGSTFSRNTTSSGSGGGLYISGTVNLLNSTFSGNSAGANGGGGIFDEAGYAAITNTTFFSNSATSGGANIFITGTLPITLTLKNTLLTSSATNCAGLVTAVSLGHNLENGNSCGLTATGDITNTNPLIGPLANNGDSIQTHKLLTNSPAIDAGDNTTCPAIDQREVDRPLGAGCDIGAYESVPAHPVAATQIPPTGGALNPGDGTLIQLPPGAVTATVTLTYTSRITTSHPPPTNLSIIRSFKLEAVTGSGQVVTQLQQPITITIEYTDAELAALGVSETNLNVAAWNSNTWVYLLPCAGCSVDTVNNRIIIVLNQLTEFALLSSPVRIYLPIIWR